MDNKRDLFNWFGKILHTNNFDPATIDFTRNLYELLSCQYRHELNSISGEQFLQLVYTLYAASNLIEQIFYKKGFEDEVLINECKAFYQKYRAENLTSLTECYYNYYGDKENKAN